DPNALPAYRLSANGPHAPRCRKSLSGHPVSNLNYSVVLAAVQLPEQEQRASLRRPKWHLRLLAPGAGARKRSAGANADASPSPGSSIFPEKPNSTVPDCPGNSNLPHRPALPECLSPELLLAHGTETTTTTAANAAGMERLRPRVNNLPTVPSTAVLPGRALPRKRSGRANQRLRDAPRCDVPSQLQLNTGDPANLGLGSFRASA